jgi:hypothetical protein
MSSSETAEGTSNSGRAASAFVLAVWLGLTLGAIQFVRVFAAPFPFGDEGDLWDLLPPFGGLSLRALWKLKNEHRIPLPRLLQYVPYVLSDDLRAPMVLQVLILSGVALLSIAVVRRIRGRTAWSDTLFPLVWLHTGNWANLLSGFQIALTLPTALVTAILAGIAVSPGRAGVRRAIGMGSSLACLPLCGAVGLVQVPLLGAWLAGLGWSGRRSADPDERKGSRILLASVGLCAAFCALHFLGYRRAHWLLYSSRPTAVLEVVAKVLSLGLGPAARTYWPASAVFVLSLLAATVVLLLSGFARGSSENRRRLGLLTALAGMGCLVLSIGIGRADFSDDAGFTARYITLTAPILCCVSFAWILYGGRATGAVVCGLLALAAWAVLPENARIGSQQGQEIQDQVGRFEDLVGRGASPLELVLNYTKEFPFHYPQRSREILESLAFARKPPFDHGRAPDPAIFEFLTFSRVPSRVEPWESMDANYVDGHHVVLVRPGTSIHLDLLAGETRVSGSFGIPSEIDQGRKAGRIRILVESVPRDRPPRTLLDRTLTPASVESDRGIQPFAIDGVEDGPGEIVLRTESADDAKKIWDRSYWTDIRIQ